MKKLLGIMSLIFITTNQLLAGTFSLAELTKKEIQTIQENSEGFEIQYDEENNEITLDDSLIKELRNKGVLQTQESVKSTVCKGGGH